MPKDPKDWSPRVISKKKISDATHDALQAFWAEIAKTFPQVPSGDLDPMTVVMFDEHAFDVVLQWLANNLPNKEAQARAQDMLNRRRAGQE